MQPTPPALRDQSLTHGAAREAPGLWVLYRPDGAAQGLRQALPPPEKTQRLNLLSLTILEDMGAGVTEP